MGTETPNWFVKDQDDIAGPLTEAEMRQLVMHPSKRTLYVRQGTSEWHPAEVIRNKIAVLANNGIYVLASGVAEGPFTFTKAYEVLQAPKYVGAEVRTGLNGQWVAADLWLARVDDLKRERELQNEGGPLSGMMADVANLAGKFLENVDKPGARLLGSQSPDSPAIKRNKAVSSQTKLAIGIGLIVALVGLAAWMALRAYQRRHISSQYRIDATYTALPPTSKTAGAGATKVGPGQLFRPTFKTTQGKASGGTAFAAKVPERDGTFVVSALHLLGPAGGLSSDIPAAGVAQQWQGLSLQDALNSEPASEVEIQPIAFNKSAPFPESSVHGDVIACSLTNANEFQTTAFALSSRSTQLGERVSMIANIDGFESFVHPAVISSIENGWLVYTFDEPRLNLRATNGAPVVDQSGSVIGVNAGGGQEQGIAFGIGTPVAKFYGYLLSEL